MSGGGRKKACDTCHMRKIYCDSGLPNCDWCTHQGLVCTFDRKSGAKRPRNTRLAKDTANQKLVPAVAIDASLSSPSLVDVPVPVPAFSSLGTSSHLSHLPPNSISQDPSAGYLFSSLERQDWAWGSSPFSSTEGRDWIQSRTGESVLFDVLSPTPIGPPWQRESQLNHRPVLSVETTVANLPEKTITEKYLQLFRSMPFRLVFPLVDTVLFQTTIDLAYERGHDSVSSRACVFSFLSIMAHTQWAVKSSSAVDGDACAKQAELLSGLVTSDANLVGLQFHIMTCIYQLFSGNLQVATKFHATACRILFMMGGHLYVQPTSQDIRIRDGADHERRTKVQLRKLFWLCYTFDKVLVLRTGQPPCIDDEQCDLTLPSGYAEMLYSEGDFDTAPSTTLCLFPGDLRLSIIKSRTCKLLYPSHTQKLSDAELLWVVRELDSELERWRTSIPLQYRPALSCRDDGHGFDPAMDSTQKMHIIIIHLEYHHLMATIHQTASRSFAWNCEDGANIVNQDVGISSSRALAVEASRASLVYLRVAAHALMGPTFWIIVFYPINAILTIFGNILLDPLEPQAEQDIELLEFTADLIKRIRSREYIPIDNMDISRMDSFVSEVIRLGKCAITAARRGLLSTT